MMAAQEVKLLLLGLDWREAHCAQKLIVRLFDTLRDKRRIAGHSDVNLLDWLQRLL